MISEQDQRHYLAIARRAAAEAAEVIRTHKRRADLPKRVIETLCQVDLAVERFVRDFLHNKTPGMAFWARRKAAIRPATSCYGCSIPSTAR